MVVFKRMVALVAVAAVAMVFAACERTITRVEEVQSPQSCFECHSDNNTFLVAAEEQWQNSIHASSLNIDRGGSASCAGCHTSEGFIQRATGQTVTAEDNPTPIHCFTCHAPHTNGDFGLRWTAVATSLSGDSFDLGAGNLCVACHQARRDVATYVSGRPKLSEHWGPHYGVQGDNLIGTNGYEYSGFTYEITTHREATEDGCLDCHFKATSNSVVGGHAFNMRFDLRDEGGNVTEVLNTAACEPCHGEIDDFADVGNGYSVQDSVDALVEELEVLVEAAGLWENGHPKPDVTTSADSAGAVWNLRMIEDDRSHGVHNAKYMMGLLRSAIMYLEGDLPQTSPASQVAETKAPGDRVAQR